MYVLKCPVLLKLKELLTRILFTRKTIQFSALMQNFVKPEKRTSFPTNPPYGKVLNVISCLPDINLAKSVVFQSNKPEICHIHNPYSLVRARVCVFCIVLIQLIYPFLGEILVIGFHAIIHSSQFKNSTSFNKNFFNYFTNLKFISY